MTLASRFTDALADAISRCSRSTVFWCVAATVWIVFGFAIDGTSEPGHHAALILGGACLGCGLANTRR